MSNLFSVTRLRLLVALRRYCAFDLITLCRIRRVPSEKLGSSECGWIVPHSWPGNGDVCFCFGAGEDITFDVALRKLRGCVVHTFDPTPRAIAHHATLPDADRNAVTFHAIGIWNQNQTMQFFAPAVKEHVSHSLVAPASGEVGFQADCKTLATIIGQVGAGSPALLKMDIEGAEMEVLEGVLATATPKVLLVEFDELTPLTSSRNWARVRDMVRHILSCGYELYSVDQNNYGFIRRS